MPFLDKLFGDPNKRVVVRLEPLVERINALESEIQKLSDDELKAKTSEFRQRFEGGETLDDLLPEAFACVREAAQRVLGQRHFDVQLMGGVVLYNAAIAEMKTGEGKTLSSIPALYLHSLTGRSVHLVTVNDYLAKRDCGWNGPIYHLLGVSCTTIVHDAAFIYDPEFEDKSPQW